MGAPDGAIFADFLSTLMSSGPNNPGSINELGQSEAGKGLFAVMTGSNSNGTIATGHTCGTWSMGTGDQYIGNLEITGATWQTVLECDRRL